MADRWMEERERRMREREWRRSEQYGRDGKPDPSQMGGADREGEDRSWRRSDGRGYAGYRPGGGEAQGYADADRYYNDDDYRPAPPRADYRQGAIDYRNAPSSYEAPRYHGSPQPRSYDAGYRSYVGSDQAFRGHRSGTEDFMYRLGEKVAAWFQGDAHPFGEARSHRGLGPKGYKRSDERISEEAHDRLTEDNWLDATEIQVSVSNGDVTLSGMVEDRGSKHLAERLVEDIGGVRHVQNNLRIADRAAGAVNAGSGPAPTDKPTK